MKSFSKGSGKTLVGAEIIRTHLEAATEHRCVFIVPTNILLTQQQRQIQRYLGTETQVVRLGIRLVFD